MSLLCTRKQEETMFVKFLRSARRWEKFLKKNIAKSFADSKIVLIFATAFASKNGEWQNRNQGGKKALRDKEFFEDIWAAKKVLFTLEKE